MASLLQIARAQAVASSIGSGNQFALPYYPAPGDLATIENSSSFRDWFVASNLDWGVNSEPAQFRGRDLEDCRVVFRTDTGEPLGTVGNEYTPQSNWDVLSPLREAFESGAVSPLGGGSLARNMRIADKEERLRRRLMGAPTTVARSGGAELFVSFRLNGLSWEIVPNDVLFGVGYFSWSHNGTTPSKFTLEIRRLMCMNGASTTVGGINPSHGRTRHTERIAVRWADFEADFADFVGAAERTIEIYKRLAAIRLTANDAQTAVAQAIGGKSNFAELAGKKRGIAETVIRAAIGAPGADIAGGLNTGWGVFNGLTYVQTHGGGRTDSSNMRNRLEQKGAATETALVKALLAYER